MPSQQEKQITLHMNKVHHELSASSPDFKKVILLLAQLGRYLRNEFGAKNLSNPSLALQINEDIKSITNALENFSPPTLNLKGIAILQNINEAKGGLEDIPSNQEGALADLQIAMGFYKKALGEKEYDQSIETASKNEEHELTRLHKLVEQQAKGSPERKKAFKAKTDYLEKSDNKAKPARKFLSDVFLPNSAIRVDIENKITDIEKYSEALAKTAKETSKKLVTTLRQLTTDFFAGEKTEKNIRTFKEGCNKHIRTADKTLSTHWTAKTWKRNLANFLTSISVIGLVAKVAYSRYRTSKTSLFFQKPKITQTLHGIKKTINLSKIKRQSTTKGSFSIG